jgi:hypothetical protein
MSQNNPFKNPLQGQTGLMDELLAALSDEELDEHTRYHQWEQEHRIFSEKNMYTSRGYHAYRTLRWAGQASHIKHSRNQTGTSSEKP